MRNAVEVVGDIRVHHPTVPRLQRLGHLAQRILAAALWPKAIAHRQKLLLENRFDHQLQRRLYDPIFDRRNPEPSPLPRCLGNLHFPDPLRSVAPRAQRSFQLLQVPLGVAGKILNALPVYTAPPSPARHLLPGDPQRLGRIHLVDQTKPLASFYPLL